MRFYTAGPADPIAALLSDAAVRTFSILQVRSFQPPLHRDPEPAICRFVHIRLAGQCTQSSESISPPFSDSSAADRHPPQTPQEFIGPTAFDRANHHHELDDHQSRTITRYKPASDPPSAQNRFAIPVQPTTYDHQCLNVSALAPDAAGARRHMLAFQIVPDPTAPSPRGNVHHLVLSCFAAGPPGDPIPNVLPVSLLHEFGISPSFYSGNMCARPPPPPINGSAALRSGGRYTPVLSISHRHHHHHHHQHHRP